MVVMGKAAHMRLEGGKHFRQRILLSTLSSVPIVITDIRSDDTTPGLLLHEISLLRLVEKISDDCTIEINETGKNKKLIFFFFIIFRCCGLIFLGRVF